MPVVRATNGRRMWLPAPPLSPSRGQHAAPLSIHGQGGFVEVRRVRWEGGKKLPAADAGLEVGTILGR